MVPMDVPRRDYAHTLSDDACFPLNWLILSISVHTNVDYDQDQYLNKIKSRLASKVTQDLESSLQLVYVNGVKFNDFTYVVVLAVSDAPVVVHDSLRLACEGLEALEVIESDAVWRSCDAVWRWVVTASRVICDAVSNF
ncbi:hypothetical protein Tco_1476425 [Tanacetum coccineum]